jgi:hypothetical protein
MRIFRRGDKKEESPDYIEARFQTAVDLIKDLDRSEFKRFVDGLTLTWQGYDKIRQVQSREEKELGQVTAVEKKLEFIEEGQE